MKTIIIFVDGSYTIKNPDVVGWGYISQDGKLSNHGAFTKDNNPYDILDGRQIGGEIKATMEAVKYALDQGYDELTIKFDYDGIENWALGKWKRNKPYTKVYHKYMERMMKKIKVTFEKVDSGDNPADAEARKATGAESAH